MKSRRLHLLFIVCVAVLVSLLCLIASSQAASTESTPDTASLEVKETSFIPMAEISTRVNEIKGRFREIEQKLSETEWNEEVQKVLSEKAKKIASRKAEFETALSEGINVFKLKKMRSVWIGIRDGLTAQDQITGERTKEIDDWLREAERQISLWQRTKKEAQKASAQKTVHKEVDETIKVLKSMEKKIRKGRDVVLDIQSRIQGHLETVETVLDRIHDQQDILRRNFFVRQDSPVWRMRIATQEITEEVTGLVNILRKEIANVLEFIDLYINQLIVRFLCIALILWLVKWASDVLKKYGGDVKVSGEDVHTGILPPDVSSYAISAAILLGLTLNLLIYLDLPTGLQVLIIIATLPVWLRVLVRLQTAVQITHLLVLAVLVVMKIVLAYAVQYPFLSRLLIIIESVLGLVLVRAIQRSVGYKRTAELMGKGMWFGIVDAWLKVMIFAFSAGLGASLLGYSSLAITMHGLAVWGAFIGTLLFCAVRTTEVIVFAIVNVGKLDRLKMILTQPERFLTVIRRGIRVLAFFVWIYYVLETLTLWAPLRESAASVLSASFGYGAFTFSLGGLFAFGLTLWISWILSRFVSYVLAREVFTRLRMPPGIPFALTSFSRYTILVIGVIIALATLGIRMDRLVLLISALGVGIGFGLQNVVNNFVSGIILLFERPIRVGDKVELEGLYGTVTDIGIRASNVRNFDGADVIVPNGDFISARVVNWTLADQKRRIILPVGVAYGTDPTKVLEILESVARSHVEVLVDPVPEALFRGFGESSLDFELRAWTESDRGWLAVMSDLAVATNDALADAGIEIPFPQRDLHLKSVKPEVQDKLSGEVPADKLGEEKQGDE